MLATTGPRELLRVAIAERDQAVIAEIEATKAAVRAKQILDDAEAQLAALAGVDQEVAAHQGSEIKAWANGGERPAGALPAHLISKRSLKVEAEANVAAARSAHGVLQKELLEASGRLQSREVAVERAAGAVLSSEAEPIIEQLLQARRAVWAFED